MRCSDHLGAGEDEAVAETEAVPAEVAEILAELAPPAETAAPVVVAREQKPLIELDYNPSAAGVAKDRV